MHDGHVLRQHRRLAVGLHRLGRVCGRSGPAHAIKLETGTGAPRDCVQLDGTRTLYDGPMSAFPRPGRSTEGVALTGVGTEAMRFRISYTLAADAPPSAEG